jgi:hypothetical protein
MLADESRVAQWEQTGHGEVNNQQSRGNEHSSVTHR